MSGKILIETKGKKKPKLQVSVDDHKILQQEFRFKAKRDEQLLAKLQTKKEDLEYWFHNTYPEMYLKVQLIMSRKVEELEVRKELKYYKNEGTTEVIALTNTVDSHTWYNPYMMDDYIESFVETNKNAIEKIIQYRENYK